MEKFSSDNTGKDPLSPQSTFSGQTLGPDTDLEAQPESVEEQHSRRKMPSEVTR